MRELLSFRIITLQGTLTLKDMSDNEKMPEENLPKNENEKREQDSEIQPSEPAITAKNEIDSPSEETDSPKEAAEEGGTAEEPAVADEGVAKEPEAAKEETAEEPAAAEEGVAEEPEAAEEEVAEEPAAAEEEEPAPGKVIEEKEDALSEEDIDKPEAKSEPTAKKDAQTTLDDAVAEDSEDETANDRHGIEKKDYHAMSKENLVVELGDLLKKEKVQSIKEHVEEIRAEFNAKFDEEVEQKKEEFLADGGNIIDFYYSTPLKKEFNSIYFDYKEKRNSYYQKLKQDHHQNLEKRLEIIEELKGLIDVEENINTTYRHFKELQERWRNAGAIPRDKYNTVWNTYHHHVENFYDFLHLNREFRDLDFKHNLEQKLKIITRAEELTQEEDTNRAFRELQMLHKMWKEDLGPVEREYREDIWQKFSEATKKIHDKRQEYFDDQEKQYENNLVKKQGIIVQLKEVSQTEFSTHKQWQQKIHEVEVLREQFFSAGKVPRELNDQTWKDFKEVVRTFNRNKNAFYKNQKKDQYENLEKKLALVQIAEDNKDSEDFKATTALMKKIQDDWKTIGHVPRKDSDKIWKQFKNACNHYFDRLHASRNEENKEETEAFEKKKELLDSLKTLSFSGERKKDLPEIKKFIEAWKSLGKVPHSKRYIEGKFNKGLDQAFEKLDLDKTQTEMLKYENKLQALEDADDNRKIDNEHYFLTKKVEETKAEIRQLENNLQFFSNVDDDNPLVKTVHQNIQNHKDQLVIWQEKLEKIRTLY